MRKLPIAALGLSVAVAGCQDYDFHHVSATPVTVVHDVTTFGADAGTAYIMIVQDTSGSMCQPIATGVATTASGCAKDATQSKLSLVAQDFTAVLEGLDGGSPFFIGLTAFPGNGGDGCQPPSNAVYAIGSSTTNIPKIINWYASATPVGGTPTAATLALAGKDPDLVTATAGGSRYIILLTDGYPNCNPNDPCVTDPQLNLWSDGKGHGCMSPTQENLVNGNTAMPPPQCMCGNGACTDASKTNMMASDCCYFDNANNLNGTETTEASEDCLDDTNTDSTLQALFAQGIETFVVGVGSGFTNYDVLNAMASAGSGGKIAMAYQASSVPALQAAIQSIIGSVTATCTFTLNPPPANPALVEVVFDQMDLAPNDATNGFTYDPTSSVVTIGTAVCATVKDGKQHTVNITDIANSN